MISLRNILASLFQFLQRREVRTLLMPYFFATFAPPWYYKEYMPSNIGEDAAAFIRQYGEGAWVTLTLLSIAYNGYGFGSTNGAYPKDVKAIIRRETYPNLHMLEIPAITGKEPFMVWQLISQLSPLVYGGGITTLDRYTWFLNPTGPPLARQETLLLSEVLQKRAENALPGTWWSTLDKQAQKYLMLRACDLVAFGEVVADRTFPQPTLPGATPLQVSAVVTALMVLLMEAQGKANVSQDQEWERYKEKLVRECLWKYDGLFHLQVYQAEGRVHMRHMVEHSLPARVLTAEERKTLIDACLTELAHAKSVLATLKDFDTFCQLLRQPENHVMSATPVYAEREVNTYTTQEMTNQVARELMNLLPRTAYAKVVSLVPGSASVWKGKYKR